MTAKRVKVETNPMIKRLQQSAVWWHMEKVKQPEAANVLLDPSAPRLVPLDKGNEIRKNKEQSAEIDHDWKKAS